VICFTAGDVGLDSINSINAVVAALDLQLVRLLRKAMSPGGNGSIAGIGPAPTFIAPRTGAHPERAISPRPVVHPQPRFAPRPVHHPEPRFEPASPRCAGAPVVVIEVTEPPGKTHSPIEPPWKVQPWETPLPPRPKVKVQVRPPDKIISKGSLIDLFC
jgi:hypothetical protein